jgi:hypothetical protein
MKKRILLTVIMLTVLLLILTLASCGALKNNPTAMWLRINRAMSKLDSYEMATNMKMIFYVNGQEVKGSADIVAFLRRQSPDGKIHVGFTVMTTQWPNAEDHYANAWPWMDFVWPQRIYQTDKGAPHAVSVSIAQHSGTVCFSDSSLKGNYTNRGRSFVNPNNIPSSDKEAFDKVLKAAYEAWDADHSLSNLGLNFQAQWDYALQSEAPTILVTGWNEWIAGNWGCFVDTASVEFSRDAEMMRGGYFDNYYMQLISNVQMLKGSAPVIIQDARN